MFTFFKKIRRHLIEGSEVRRYVFYAAGEILLVVFGIMIALQVNNWNEKRKQNVREYEIVQSLHNEFQTNKAYLESRVNSVLEKQRSALYLLGMTHRTPEFIEEDTLIHHIGMFTTMPPFVPKTAISQSILSSGELRLLSNDALKYALIRYQDALAFSYNGVTALFERGTSPQDSRAQFIGGVNSAIYFGQHTNIPFLTGLERSNIFQLDSEVILSDPKFEDYISWHLERLAILEKQLIQALEIIQESVIIIEQEYQIH